MEAMTLSRADVEDITGHLDAISACIPLRPIKTKKDYKTATVALNALLDAGGADEKHPLSPLVGLVGEMIGAYEDKHAEPRQVSPADMLLFVMDLHGLSQSELPEIGSQGVVSEILRGKRELNVRQIRLLAARFKVGPELFL